MNVARLKWSWLFGVIRSRSSDIPVSKVHMVLGVLGEVKIPTPVLVSSCTSHISITFFGENKEEKSVPSILATGLPASRSPRLVVLVISSPRAGADVDLVRSVLIWVDVSWLRNFSDIGKYPQEEQADELPWNLCLGNMFFCRISYRPVVLRVLYHHSLSLSAPTCTTSEPRLTSGFCLGLWSQIFSSQWSP